MKKLAALPLLILLGCVNNDAVSPKPAPAPAPSAVAVPDPTPAPQPSPTVAAAAPVSQGETSTPVVVPVSGECPDLRGEYSRENDRGQTQKATVTQDGCSLMTIRYELPSSRPGLPPTLHADVDLVLDGVCRTYTTSEDFEACVGHRFEGAVVVGTVVNLRSPYADFPFTSSFIRYSLDTEGNFQDSLETLDPTGAKLGTYTQTWERIR